MQFSTLIFNYGNKNRWFCAKLCGFILFVYIIILHILLLIHRRDLEWMPPRPDDLSYATDSPSKKHPDGPLLMSDGLLSGGTTKEKLKGLNKGGNVEYKIREMPQKNLRKTIKPLPINQSFLNVSFEYRY
uniref:Transmembrane protein n=1 Tax=Meloidogyne hapla TaxID=6305 RepID=A0A1I8AZS5_MELHA